MKDLGIKLNPVSKLKLFCAVKKVIHRMLHKRSIPLKRAEEIMNYVKKYVIDIETPEKAKQFYLHLGEKFEELKGVKHKFKIEEEEKIHQVFSLLVDEFMGKGDIDLASEIIEQMRKTKNSQKYLEKLEINYPIEFQKALEKIL